VLHGSDSMACYVLSVQWDKATGRFLEAKRIYVNPMGNSYGLIYPVDGGRYVVLKTPYDKAAGFYSAESGKRVFTLPKYLQVGWVVGPRVLAVQRDGPPAEAKNAKLTAYDP